MLQRRLRFGLEGGFHRLVEETRLLEGTAEATARVVEGRIGVEYFLNDRLAVRGGYVRSAWDADLDAPRTLSIGRETTFGIGYLPRGGLIQIDAAIRLLDYAPDYEGDPRVEQSQANFSLGARFLL
jgi:hypothetical protein